MAGQMPRRPPGGDDPDACWNWEEGAELAEKLAEDTDPDELSCQLKEKAGDFFESIHAKALSIGETIRATQRFTPNQKRALENMQGGVDRWLENDHGHERDDDDFD